MAPSVRNFAAKHAFGWIPLSVKLRLMRVPGVARLRRRLFTAVGDGVYQVEPADLGIRMRLNLELHKMFLDFRTFEGHLVDHLVANVRPGQVALDVGAYIGYVSLLFAKKVGPTGRVVAFEPFPANQERVRDNAALSGCANVEVAPVALSDHEGTSALYVDVGSDAGVADQRTSLVGDRLAGREQRVIEVEVLTLDAWVARAGPERLDWVKVDVEGAELAVLRGMRGTLAKLRPTVVIEFNDDADAAAGRAFFDEVGYRHRVLGRSAHGIHLVAEPV